MTNIKRVSESEALGEVETTDQPDTPATTLRTKYSGSDTGSRVIVNIPADQLTRIRLEAREAEYGNRQSEEQVLSAVDEAVFERVRPIERLNLDRATSLIDSEGTAARSANLGRPNVLQRAADHRAELASIRKELRDGRTPVAELADRYEKVRRAVHQRDGRALIEIANQADRLREKIDDPLKAAEHTLSMMPVTTWRPLGIARW